METTEYAALIVIIKSSAREDNTNDIYAKKMFTICQMDDHS